MTEQVGRKLSIGRVLLFTVAAGAALAGPVVMGIAGGTSTRTQQPSAASAPASPATVAMIQKQLEKQISAVKLPPEGTQAAQRRTSPDTFEVASIRLRNSESGGGGRGGSGAAPPACGGSPATVDPGRFSVSNVTLFRLISMAYGWECTVLESSEVPRLIGGPDWIRSDKFDVEALIPKDSPVYTRQQLSMGQAPRLQAMLQNLLAERFKLSLRRDLKEMSAYSLTTTTDTPKLTLWKEGEGRAYTVNTGLNASGQISTAIGGRGRSMDELAEQISLVMHRPVINQTKITGEFTYAFEFAPREDQPGLAEMRADGRWTIITSPSLFDALEEQLRLKLVATKAPVEILVVDRAERPSEN